MTIRIREYKKEDVNEAVNIWNQVVEDGEAFPQMELLTEKTGDESSGDSHLPVLLTTRIPERSQVCISCIRIISDAAGISAMPAMLCEETCGDSTLEKNW